MTRYLQHYTIFVMGGGGGEGGGGSICFATYCTDLHCIICQSFCITLVRSFKLGF